MVERTVSFRHGQEETAFGVEIVGGFDLQRATPCGVAARPLDIAADAACAVDRVVDEKLGKRLDHEFLRRLEPTPANSQEIIHSKKFRRRVADPEVREPPLGAALKVRRIEHAVGANEGRGIRVRAEGLAVADFAEGGEALDSLKPGELRKIDFAFEGNLFVERSPGAILAVQDAKKIPFPFAGEAEAVVGQRVPDAEPIAGHVFSIPPIGERANRFFHRCGRRVSREGGTGDQGAGSQCGYQVPRANGQDVVWNKHGL